jgi:hypothetical protein
MYEIVNIIKNGSIRLIIANLTVSLLCFSLSCHGSDVNHASNNSAENLRYQELPTQGSVSINIDRHSPVFEFHTGVSHYAAYRIPVTDKPLLIELVSFLDHQRSDLNSRVFYPLVALINSDFFVTRTTSLEDLHFDLPYLARSSQPAYRVGLRIEPNSTEKYLVVYTPSALFKKKPLGEHDDGLSGESIFGYGASDTGMLSLSVSSLSN